MTFDSQVELNGFYVTNATYTYLSMKDGDGFTKKFGGAHGMDADYFKLIIYGNDSEGNKLDSVEFFQLILDLKKPATIILWMTGNG